MSFSAQFLKLQRLNFLQPQEITFWDSLTLAQDRPDYFFFAKAYKEAAEDDHRLEPDSGRAWDTASDRIKRRYIIRGKILPNPLVQREFFDLTDAFKKNSATHDAKFRNDFRFFVYGMKTYFHEEILHEDTVYQQYLQLDDATKARFQSLGYEAWENYIRCPERVTEQLRNDDRGEAYLFEPGPIAAPTTLDADHVIKHLGRYGKGINWIYIKPLYENKSSRTKLKRSVYLFARGDDQNHVLDVRIAYHSLESFQRLIFPFKYVVVKVQGYETQDKASHGTSNEFDLQLKLSHTGCQHVLQCYGHSLRRTRFPFLGYGYLEYTPRGDLLNFINLYQASVPLYLQA